MMKLDPSVLLEVIKHAPLVSIDMIVRNTRHEVLLGLRNNEPAKDSWFVPGGRIRKGERIAEAFRRIAQEELGTAVDFAGARFVGVFEHLYSENFARQPECGTHYVVLAYEIAFAESLDTIPHDQHRTVRWFTVKDILHAQDVHPYTKRYFEY